MAIQVLDLHSKDPSKTPGYPSLQEILMKLKIKYLWYLIFRDIPSISTKLGTQPIFLDADVHSTIPGGPIGGQTRVSLRNDHFTYLLTWYTLSATTLFMWCKRFLVK